MAFLIKVVTEITLNDFSGSVKGDVDREYMSVILIKGGS